MFFLLIYKCAFNFKQVDKSTFNFGVFKFEKHCQNNNLRKIKFRSKKEPIDLDKISSIKRFKIELPTR